MLPGFIDCHVHLTIAKDDYQVDHLRLSSADKTLRALKAAQGLLVAGFTTIRSAGDADKFYPSFALAKSIENGHFVGPRITGAGHYISVTGGGGDINFLSADNGGCCHPDGIVANGSDQMIEAVRSEIKYGSDWIKLLVRSSNDCIYFHNFVLEIYLYCRSPVHLCHQVQMLVTAQKTLIFPRRNCGSVWRRRGVGECL